MMSAEICVVFFPKLGSILSVIVSRKSRIMCVTLFWHKVENINS